MYIWNNEVTLFKYQATFTSSSQQRFELPSCRGQNLWFTLSREQASIQQHNFNSFHVWYRYTIVIMTVLKFHWPRLYVYIVFTNSIGVISSDLGCNRMSPPQLSIFLWRSLSVIGKIVSLPALGTAVRGTFLYCVDFWVLQRNAIWTLHNFIIWPCVFLCHQCNLFQQTTSATCKQIIAWVSVYCNLYEISFKATLLSDFVQTIQCT